MQKIRYFSPGCDFCREFYCEFNFAASLNLLRLLLRVLLRVNFAATFAATFFTFCIAGSSSVPCVDQDGGVGE